MNAKLILIKYLVDAIGFTQTLTLLSEKLSIEDLERLVKEVDL